MRRPKDPDARVRVLARYLVGEGHHDVDHGMKYVTTPQVAYLVGGGNRLPHNKTMGQLLNETKERYLNQVPAVVRTVGPEIEQAQITLRLDDFLALTRGSRT